MRKTLLSLALAALMSVGTISAQTTCGIDGGSPAVTPPNTLWAVDGVSQPAEVTLGNLPSYDFVVTTPEMTIEFDGAEKTGEFIAGVTHNGIFDFNSINNITGANFEAGNYKLTAFAYDQEELNAFVLDNGATIELLLGVTLTSPAVLSEIFDVIAGISGPVSIFDVEDAICNLLQIINPVPLQYDVAYDDAYTIALYPVGVEDNVYTQAPALAINNISPIPAVNYVDVSLTTSNAYANNIINIYDLTGKLVDAIKTNKNDFRIDLSTYNVGMYFISVSNGTETVNSKFYKR